MTTLWLRFSTLASKREKIVLASCTFTVFTLREISPVSPPCQGLEAFALALPRDPPLRAQARHGESVLWRTKCPEAIS